MWYYYYDYYYYYYSTTINLLRLVNSSVSDVVYGTHTSCTYKYNDVRPIACIYKRDNKTVIIERIMWKWNHDEYYIIIIRKMKNNNSFFSNITTQRASKIEISYI